MRSAHRDEGWAAQRVGDLHASLRDAADCHVVLQRGVGWAVETLDIDLAVVLRGGEPAATAGAEPGELPCAALSAAVGATCAVCLPTTGPARAAGSSFDGGRLALVAVRSGDGDFAGAELGLLAAGASALELALATAELRSRERLVRHVGEIQRLVSSTSPLEAVCDAIAAAAVDVLGSPIAALRLVDEHDAAAMTLAACRGLDPALAHSLRHAPVGEGVGGRAIVEGTLVVADDYGSAPERLGAMSGVRAAMAVPVLDRDAVAGSLTVATDAVRRYTEQDAEVLARLAEHAGVALAAARTAGDARHAFADALTGLPNRRLFLDRLEQAVARAERSGGDVTVLLLDLDGFKLVNDSLGRLAGDRLLVQVAERLRGCLRRSDTAARLGGDEFGVLLAEAAGRTHPTLVAERIVNALAAPFDVHDRLVSVRASIGIATGVVDADELLREASVATMRAKSRSRGGYAVFEPGMHAEALEQIELRADLQGALERGEIVLHYQPIVDFATGRVSAVEALARWQHPTRGLVPPDVFIPLAEETGLILALGAHVLESACRQLRRWSSAFGREDLCVSVNLSAHQLRPGLAAEVGRALAVTGLPPERLILEITETGLLNDTDATLDRLAELKALGVRLAIDDFGTGYSSLRYLRRFPVDVLKIAKPFVDGIETVDGEESALARTIIDLAASLHMSTIAEGIEERGQLELLRELGCEQGQGYLFARPLDAAAVTALLDAELVEAPA